MRVQISQEDRIVVEEILRELMILQKELSNALLNSLIILSGAFMRFIYSYQEYSIPNIKKKGLREILWGRAIRFFGLDNHKEESAKSAKSKGRKRIVRRVFINIGKVVLLPVYLILLLIDFLRNRKRNRNRKSSANYNRYVKHQDIE